MCLNPLYNSFVFRFHSLHSISMCVESASIEHTVWNNVVGGWSWSFGWRGINHELEALFCRRQFRNVMFGMRSADMLLHGAISLFLHRNTQLLRLNFAERGSFKLKQYKGDSRAGNSHRGSVCDSWIHPDFSMDRQLHCSHPPLRRTMSKLIEAASSM